ncbi:bifunctional D-glycero-beta-D-manno-heptose-7-phosphate kinase/D-glycero-beta-D-manno-heptose 1-phosphate adenylyltransferase HldE [Bermanella marisrubri]|uniref:Bifunctional protein HldE n=1 Tax=Bermanella marisrubri TaxID=207949 RepID=Q1N2L0_9GAMM|nr:bifunctional D-glycero-beta-D-manno-heptose-7-phosphate kinase/D-glycero-beta-D-manno-heptose 1-phosphate adenylyltransferase HldE [Bermanella marisrubri]EAT12397.1 ADP-heptose synthase [Oceanobacter sp. RED65] [Bermanella marisrubri]QIZ85478.1 bifunctional D-glycero-beta-D-manno-heptose-7-phosphate kinase/D-glycero-beta-D-manno-heptose 1-phosphate adenylyltransferase HldE [Bermanella marisrubri]
MTLSIPQFDQAKVLVVGDVMLDRYWSGPTSRISPEAPVPVVKVTDIEDRAGGAGNVALNIASLNAYAGLIGLVGNDNNAKALVESLQHNHIQTQFSYIDSHPTITKLRVLSRHQQLIRLDFEESFGEVDNGDMLEQYQTLLPEYDVIILSDYGKGALHNVEAFIELGRNAGKTVLVDPKGTDFSKYRGASLITPNMSEFEGVVGTCKDEADVVSKGFALLEELNLQALLVTRSEKGMTLFQKNQQPVHLAATAQEVYDVTGAGDTVISVLASALAAGQSYTQATALANTAAALVVAKLGTATVSVAELRQAAKADAVAHDGIVDEEQLKQIILSAKAEGETLVMTNGCFDILHPGHVSYLKAAKALGDKLIVAVNTDDSVRRLKGPDRPINSTEHRMDVLAGLSSVDYVVAFSEDTPQRLIANLLPDILVKGGDYKIEDIAGGQEVISNGGEVKVLNFEEGCSTTNIINSIKQHGK